MPNARFNIETPNTPKRPRKPQAVLPPIPPTATSVASSDPYPQYPEVNTGIPGITVQPMWITPAIAQEMLNNRNIKLQRNTKPGSLRKLASDLHDGRFVFNAQPVIRDHERRVIDGQNRLNAIIISNTAAFFLVINGVDSSAFKTIDASVSRTPKDALKGLGFADAKALASALTIIWRYSEGNLLGPEMPSNAMVAELSEKHPDVIKSLSVAKSSQVILKSQAIATFFHYAFSKKDADLAEEFFYRLATGEDMKKGHPIMALRKWLIAYTGPNRRSLTYVYVIKAWNAMRQNRELTKMVYLSTESFPEIA